MPVPKACKARPEQRGPPAGWWSVVLAKRVTTVDQISGGRAVFGLGAGWQVNEHTAYGFRLPDPGERVTHFIEAIQVIRHLLDDSRAEFAGRWYTLTDAPFEPKPLQARLPLLVGTGGPRMMRAVARYADEWNTWGDPAQVRDRTVDFVGACEAVGRDPETVRLDVGCEPPVVGDIGELDLDLG